MGFLNPRPNSATIGRYYPADYRPYQRANTIRTSGLKATLRRWVRADLLGDPPAIAGWRRWVAKAARPWLRPSRDSMLDFPFEGGGRVLDFGCGAGWLSARLRDRGFDVTAMDFSEHAARHVRETYGIPALVGSLPHPDLATASFDIVVMGAVLEHVHDPHRIIDAAAQLLVPGGRLVLSVPNLDSLAFRKFGADWFSLDLPRHLLHFNPATLTRLIELHGFRVDELRQQSHPSWMKRSLEARKRSARSSGFWNSLGRRLTANRVVATLLTRWAAFTRETDCLFLVARNAAGTKSRTELAVPAQSRKSA
jgi:2-polyprenyl-3-methyl-5-hydroxy-6-metoxy-1,4-benzoquinol methylase